jgi:pimeloyl-ACP methyl ester carboxylesterase
MDAGAPGLALLRSLEASARVERTPCGDGVVEWHAWGEGPILVLLHGGFGSWMHWVRNLERLSRDHLVLAPDLPGLGGSALPPEPVSPASLGAIVAAGLEVLAAGEGPVHLVGFSFGGLVGGQVARLLGERVATLTLVGASGLGARRPPVELVRRHEGMTPAERHDAHRENLVRLMLSAREAIDPLALHVHAENDRRARLRSRRMSLGDSLREALPRVRGRVHGIWGEHDATVGPWLGERRALIEACGPASRFEVIADAGHWVQYEAPERFDAALLALIGR